MQAQKSSSWVLRDQSKLQNTPLSFCLSTTEKLSIMEALDHIHVTRQYQEMGSCSVCKKISIKKCSACGTFYCSSECQTYDWPKHKVVCSRQRDNGSDRNSVSSSKHIRTGSLKNLNDEKLVLTERGSPFTALANQLNKKSGSEYSGSKSLANFKIGNNRYQNKEQISKGSEAGNLLNNGAKDYKKSNTFERKKNLSPKKTFTSKKSPVEEKRGNGNQKVSVRNSQNIGKPLRTDTESIPNPDRMNQLKGPKIGKMEVIGTYRHSAERYWVMDVNNLEKYEEIQNHLNRNCEKYETIIPKVGLVCSCNFADEWFRGKIVSLTPEISVHFIDFGNTSKYEYEVFKKLPDNFKSMPGLSNEYNLSYMRRLANSESIVSLELKESDKAAFFLSIRSSKEQIISYFNNFFGRKITLVWEGVNELSVTRNTVKVVALDDLAFLVEFDQSVSNHYRISDLDSVKFIIEEVAVAPDGVPLVKVVEEVSDLSDSAQAKTTTEINVSEKVASLGRGWVMDTLTSTSKGMIILMPGEGPVRYGSLIPDENKDANDCVEKVLNIDNANASPYQAREGDYVLVVDKEGNDQRGKVFSNIGATYYVQLIDCGNAISTDSVYPLAEDLKGLIQLGVKITIENVISKSKMEKLETCFFTVTGEANSGKWPCTLKDTEYEIIAKVSLEKPIEQKAWQPEYVRFKSGSTVEVSSSSPPNSVFVRVVDGETEQQFLDMNMEMMQYARGGKEFASPPLPGELCCAKFEEDGCFYRGIINSIEGGKAGILFVDFGNEQDTDMKDIKPLPPSLKSFPFFAIKVLLSNVSRKPWNNMIKEYIGKLISENVELTLTYQGSVKDGVVLREKVSGIVVNEFIEKSRDRSRISHSIKSGSDLSTKSEIFLDDDMTYTTISSGTTCDIVILHVSEYEFETNHTFWATRAGVKNFEYVNSELNTLISEHCSLSAPYEPSYRELCLAEFEGSWYRAICAGKNEGSYKVFFVDFGNVCEVKPASIRKMVQKFVKAPALAMSCIINGHEKLKKSSELTEKICGMLLERTNTCIHGVEVSAFDKDTLLLKIPEVEAVLTG